jgi:hypothetical protein
MIGQEGAAASLRSRGPSFCLLSLEISGLPLLVPPANAVWLPRLKAESTAVGDMARWMGLAVPGGKK